ncbi:unnamed protein product [Nesidiocoris tenuis]|uniref:Uncharacterized protein n=1 Tax=Nesidiocoris tenuis TaxID=355587 RepID=A0A6H5GDJ2_9HEMI|nr:unnamed protein product [Nesidiocoris tenuis]
MDDRPVNNYWSQQIRGGVHLGQRNRCSITGAAVRPRRSSTATPTPVSDGSCNARHRRHRLHVTPQARTQRTRQPTGADSRREREDDEHEEGGEIGQPSHIATARDAISEKKTKKNHPYFRPTRYLTVDGLDLRGRRVKMRARRRVTRRRGGGRDRRGGRGGGRRKKRPPPRRVREYGLPHQEATRRHRASGRIEGHQAAGGSRIEISQAAGVALRLIGETNARASGQIFRLETRSNEGRAAVSHCPLLDPPGGTGGVTIVRGAANQPRDAERDAMKTMRSAKTQFRLNIGREPTLPPWRRAALPEPEPGGAEPGNPSPSINDSRPDQHGGSSDQPPGKAQQAVGATIPRIYDPGCRAVETFCGSRSATPRSMQPEDIGQRGATRPNVICWINLASNELKIRNLRYWNTPEFSPGELLLSYYALPTHRRFLKSVQKFPRSEKVWKYLVCTCCYPKNESSSHFTDRSLTVVKTRPR